MTPERLAAKIKEIEGLVGVYEFAANNCTMDENRRYARGIVRGLERALEVLSEPDPPEAPEA